MVPLLPSSIPDFKLDSLVIDRQSLREESRSNCRFLQVDRPKYEHKRLVIHSLSTRIISNDSPGIQQTVLLQTEEPN
jgi:hypothetical protein